MPEHQTAFQSIVHALDKQVQMYCQMVLVSSLGLEITASQVEIVHFFFRFSSNASASLIANKWRLTRFEATEVSFH